MGTGYSRKDTTNNIADGNIVNASDLDNEFDGIAAAFDETTGHTHDGGVDNGAPITKVGPTQDVVVSNTAVTPKTDNAIDLGSSLLEFKDLYIDGTANIDSLVADTADINGGTVDGAVIGGSTAAAGTFTTATATTGNITTVNATTVNTTNLDLTNLEVTNIKAKDGTASATVADSTGVMTIASSVLTTTDINGGTIDGATIATSDITVGSGKTLNVSAGTLTLADNQISGDKVEGGTINAITINTLTSTTANATNVNATTVDTTNIEVSTLKAKDGTSAGSIANTTGVVTLASSVLTTADINGGTIDGTAIGASTASTGAFTTLSASSTVSGTGFSTYLASPPAIGSGTASTGAFTTLTSSSTTTLNGTTIPASKTLLVSTDIGTTVQAYDADLAAFAAKTAPTGAVVGTTDTQTLTNKTISADNNTLSGIAASSFVLSNSSGNIDGSAAQKVIPAGVVVGTTDTQTLTNKTLTSPVISGGSIDNATVGATTATTGAFTTVSASGDVTLSGTGQIKLPVGSTAQRSGSPTEGMLRYNSDLDSFEGYVDGAWGGVGGAQAGGVIYENNQTVTTSYTMTSNKNGMSAGPISIADGVVVTIPTGSTWVIL